MLRRQAIDRAFTTLRGEVRGGELLGGWCAPCRKELPALDACIARSRSPHGRVLAVSIDLDPANVRRFVQRLRLTMPVPPRRPRRPRARSIRSSARLPFTVVLDRDGAVAYAGGGATRRRSDRVTPLTRRLVADRRGRHRTRRRQGRELMTKPRSPPRASPPWCCFVTLLPLVGGCAGEGLPALSGWSTGSSPSRPRRSPTRRTQDARGPRRLRLAAPVGAGGGCACK